MPDLKIEILKSSWGLSWKMTLATITSLIDSDILRKNLVIVYQASMEKVTVSGY
jgi:hypothetical protein